MSSTETQPVFKNREAATQFLRAIGVETGDTQLAELASTGRGPKYAIVNGRALYTEENLLQWVQAEASRPPRASGRGRTRSAAATAA